MKKSNRKDEILQTLVKMLESNQNSVRVTTASLAKEVGVSEAALYRHFSSKQAMFESLIEFIDNALFSLINITLEEEKQTEPRLKHIFILLLRFAEKNPGLTRIMTGHALACEDPKLSQKVSQLLNRIEVQFKQVLRERKLREGVALAVDETLLASQLFAIYEGLINRYVRSHFTFIPSTSFDERWELIKLQLVDEKNR